MADKIGLKDGMPSVTILWISPEPYITPVDLYIENLFKDWTFVDNLLKGSFQESLTRTMSESLILFNQEFYKQHDGVVMGSLPARTYTCQ